MLVRYYDKVDAFLRQKLLAGKYTKCIERFKDCHAGVRRCFVIGNGPSIKQQDLTLLKNEITFATNYFILHDRFADIHLNYLCMSDPRFWRRGFLAPNIHDVLKQYPEQILFFDFSFISVNKRLRLFDEDHCFYVNVNYDRFVGNGNVSLDPSKEVCHGNTVIIDICLPLAFYMGFEEVYLLGCDCDYGLDKADDHSNAYFYDINKQDTVPEPVKVMTDLWPKKVFASYAVMKEAFEQRGRHIFNATRGGKLEVFERACFEDVVGK